MNEWRPERRDAADAVIDRAVREIMSAEPRPGFRLRVLARLRAEPDAVATSSRWTWPRIAAAAFGAAAIVLTILLSRPADRRPEAPRAAQITAPANAPAPQASAITDHSKPSPQSLAPRNMPQKARTEPRLVRAASFMPPDATETSGPESIAPFDPVIAIEPITVTPLQMAPVAIPLIDIRPLPPLERIAISPTSPPR